VSRSKDPQQVGRSTAENADLQAGREAGRYATGMQQKDHSSSRYIQFQLQHSRQGFYRPSMLVQALQQVQQSTPERRSREPGRVRQEHTAGMRDAEHSIQRK